ncbi:PTS sugar transporter subunit IIA [Tissierella sp. Yu-01]|uniref:PTS sugar transporter subunit IIA n=1 Tax=Tissierella sp. Yu-01 TaxID=3035694 RepID=UPI00240E02CC|nr:PTS sugar transporter subunit IIA [Tissierella sp. Yu-01]WFA09256.1 PTS sugar transporter subunit IIA [Tissierella sp. Yu-01]
MEMLTKNNIFQNCKAMAKEEIIRKIGQVLVDSGYVDDNYIDAMLQREKSSSTNIGNAVAIPHGVESSKKDIKKSGIAVMVFPEGTMWDKSLIKVVIAIAGIGDEHLEILANIADKLSTEAEVEKLTLSSVDEIYNLFTSKEW